MTVKEAIRTLETLNPESELIRIDDFGETFTFNGVLEEGNEVHMFFEWLDDFEL